ncbi:MAG: MerR family transcriptional regulator [Sphingobacteriales bacterium]|nr:MAG: MerR family transcriptional regulator [Sphingobacteriales bacterium]
MHNRTDMNRFSIKDIENLTGIRAHTIRIWEQRYGILQPKRTDTNIRYYDADDLKTALKVALLNENGYKISKIHQMSADEMSSLISKVTDDEFRLRVQVNKLIEATLGMDIHLFEQLVDDYIRKWGMEKAVEQLIFLFLEKIGLMWMTDRIFPAQEHLVSNVIYRKLAIAVEKLAPAPKDAVRVLLFLPEGETHDLGLMYVQYLLRKLGKDAIYLGPDTPVKEVGFVINALRPDFAYLHLTSVVEEFDGNQYLQRISQSFPQTNFLVSGSMLRSRKYTQPGNMRFLYSLEEAREALKVL